MQNIIKVYIGTNTDDITQLEPVFNIFNGRSKSGRTVVTDIKTVNFGALNPNYEEYYSMINMAFSECDPQDYVIVIRDDIICEFNCEQLLSILENIIDNQSLSPSNVFDIFYLHKYLDSCHLYENFRPLTNGIRIVNTQGNFANHIMFSPTGRQKFCALFSSPVPKSKPGDKLTMGERIKSFCARAPKNNFNVEAQDIRFVSMSTVTSLLKYDISKVKNNADWNRTSECIPIPKSTPTAGNTQTVAVKVPALPKSGTYGVPSPEQLSGQVPQQPSGQAPQQPLMQPQPETQTVTQQHPSGQVPQQPLMQSQPETQTVTQQSTPSGQTADVENQNPTTQDIETAEKEAENVSTGMIIFWIVLIVLLVVIIIVLAIVFYNVEDKTTVTVKNTSGTTKTV